MGAAFGGSSDTMFGTRGPVNFLSKVTTGAAVLFMVTSLLLTYIGSHRRQPGRLDSARSTRADEYANFDTRRPGEEIKRARTSLHHSRALRADDADQAHPAAAPHSHRGRVVPVLLLGSDVLRPDQGRQRRAPSPVHHRLHRRRPNPEPHPPRRHGERGHRRPDIRGPHRQGPRPLLPGPSGRLVENLRRGVLRTPSRGAGREGAGGAHRAGARRQAGRNGWKTSKKSKPSLPPSRKPPFAPRRPRARKTREERGRHRLPRAGEGDAQERGPGPLQASGEAAGREMGRQRPRPLRQDQAAQAICSPSPRGASSSPSTTRSSSSGSGAARASTTATSSTRATCASPTKPS